MDGRHLLDFSSNDYLGLSQSALLKKRAEETLKAHGMGSGGSRLLGGGFSAFDKLEETLSRFLQKEASLVFGSGYLANIGVITGLFQGKNTQVFLDRSCHASIVDGVLLSRARFYRFRHNDIEHLEALLKERRDKGKRAIVVVESLYSMEGDVAPIEAIIELRSHHEFILVVDEAHAIGVFGVDGRGLVPDPLRDQVDVIVGTFGKALGGYGAFCVTSRAIRELLVNRARPFIFSTALPLPVVTWNTEAIGLLKRLDPERRRLREMAEDLRHFLAEKLAMYTPSRSQIVPMIIGENQEAVELAQRLRERGIFVKAIRPPTVPEGTARLRVSISCRHSRESIKRLKEAILDVF